MLPGLELGVMELPIACGIRSEASACTWETA
jgi:hypothetical protein